MEVKIGKNKKRAYSFSKRQDGCQTGKMRPFTLRIIVLIVAFGFLFTSSGCTLVEEDENEVYSITFKANYPGGEDFTTSILSRQKIVEVAPSVSRDGYIFRGWYYNEQGTGPEINNFQTINSNLVLYAKWEQANHYTINLISNIPQTENMILSVPYDIPASEVIPEISRYGYQFVGWFSNQSLTEPVDTSQLKNISQTLYAGWRDVETDYFVATEGNDNNDGSFERPFKTFKKALSVMTPGDTLVVFGGTYHEQLFVNKSGTEDAWLRFKAYANDTVIIDGTGITTDSLSGLWYGMIRITDVNYISIDGFTVINSPSSAIFVADGHHISITNNRTKDSQNPGIFAWYVDDLLIDGNEVESACLHPDSGLEDISLRYNKRVTLCNNFIHHSDSIGIDVAGGVQDALVYNNLIEYTGLGIYVDSWDGDLSNVQIYHNISRYNNVGVCVNTENGGTVNNVQVFDNLIFGNTDDGMVIGWGGVEGQTLTISNVHFYANQIYDNLGDGVVIYGQANSTIEQIFVYNNFIYNNLGCGIVVSGITPHLPYSLDNIWLVNNTIIRNGSETTWASGGIFISNHENAGGKMDNITIQNNIVDNNYTFSIAVWPWGKQPNKITISYNLIQGYRNAGSYGETKGYFVV